MLDLEAMIEDGRSTRQGSRDRISYTSRPQLFGNETVRRSETSNLSTARFCNLVTL